MKTDELVGFFIYERKWGHDKTGLFELKKSYTSRYYYSEIEWLNIHCQTNPKTYKNGVSDLWLCNSQKEKVALFANPKLPSEYRITRFKRSNNLLILKFFDGQMEGLLFKLNRSDFRPCINSYVKGTFDKTILVFRSLCNLKSNGDA